MASRSSAAASLTAGTSTPKKPRAARTTQPHTFIAKIYGADAPTLVIAKTQKIAHDAVVTLTGASAQDLLKAGRENWPVIDTTADPAQLRVDDTAGGAS